MTLYYYLLLLVILSIIMLAVYSIILRKKSIPLNLFVEALKNENNGHFEEAVITYETALNKFKKTKSGGNLKNKITEKLQVLRSLIEYKKSFHQ